MALWFPPGGHAQSPPEDNYCSVYVGNLDPSVTEGLIKLIFSQLGRVTRCRIIHDGSTDPYCFVEFADQGTAERAIAVMDGRNVLQKPLKVNWATTTAQRRDSCGDHHVFVGDLSFDTDSDSLKSAFQDYGEITDARVVKDTSGRSKGYGFVMFKKKEDAQRAISLMNGQVVDGRAIRTNWAARKGPYTSKDNGAPLNFEEVSTRTSPFNCTVYVGGLPQDVTEAHLRCLFVMCGHILDIKVFVDKCYAFVRFATHVQATHAICQMNGQQVGNMKIKCSWARENTHDPQTTIQAQRCDYQSCAQRGTVPTSRLYPHGYAPTHGGHTNQPSAQLQITPSAIGQPPHYPYFPF